MGQLDKVCKIENQKLIELIRKRMDSMKWIVEQGMEDMKVLDKDREKFMAGLNNLIS